MIRNSCGENADVLCPLLDLWSSGRMLDELTGSCESLFDGCTVLFFEIFGVGTYGQSRCQAERMMYHQWQFFNWAS